PRAGAADKRAGAPPFCGVNLAQPPFEPYTEAIAAHGALVFSPNPTNLRTGYEDAAFFRKYPKLVWSAGTSRQLAARIFATAVCSRVTPFPVSFSGMPQ